jgi:hypothetical protein
MGQEAVKVFQQGVAPCRRGRRDDPDMHYRGEPVGVADIDFLSPYGRNFK